MLYNRQKIINNALEWLKTVYKGIFEEGGEDGL